MDATEALRLATSAAEFINRQGDGALWRRTDEPDSGTDLTLYHGAAGIALFMLELGQATKRPEYTARAVLAGRELADRVTQKLRSSVAFATAWPGYSFSLRVLSDHAVADADRAMFRDTARYATNQLLAQATRFGTGLGWIEPMPFSDITGHSGEREIYDLSVGSAGAALALLDAHDHALEPGMLESAVSVADRLLDVVDLTPDGARWALMADMPFPFTAPNFAHGGAGVGYLMARLYERTNDPKYLDAAMSAARYTMSRASKVGDGCLVCHTEEQQPPAFYLGACHGPAGTGRLLGILGRLTGDAVWSTYSAQLLDGLRGIGAPATRSWGWWNNYGQCCGDAGLGDYALSMWTANRLPGYLELAHDCAAVLAEHVAETEGVASWPQAEHRARPKFIQSQTGYMQGAAGIASFLVHLATAEWAEPVRIVFPDESL